MSSPRENMSTRRGPRTFRALKQEEEPVNEAGKEDRGRVQILRQIRDG